MGSPYEDYVLVQSIPRRVFLREVLGEQSLAQLSLAPSATLSALRAEDRGRVESGGVEMALLTGDIDGLSYEEVLEFQERIGSSKRSRRLSSGTLNACSKVHSYNSDMVADVSDSKEARCAICLIDFERGTQLRTLWCGHMFHIACVDRWLADKEECPVCREAVKA